MVCAAKVYEERIKDTVDRCAAIISSVSSQEKSAAVTAEKVLDVLRIQLEKQKSAILQQVEEDFNTYQVKLEGAFD